MIFGLDLTNHNIAFQKKNLCQKFFNPFYSYQLINISIFGKQALKGCPLSFFCDKSNQKVSQIVNFDKQNKLM